jgi:transcriptional regulator with XRE-family HTH domain
MKRVSNSSHFRHLGLAIKVLRELKGISQAQLARTAGMGKSQISKYESGKELPKLDSLDKILLSLDATPFSLLLVVNFLDRMKSERAPDLLWLDAPLGPLLSDAEEEAFASFIRSLYGRFR